MRKLKPPLLLVIGMLIGITISPAVALADFTRVEFWFDDSYRLLTHPILFVETDHPGYISLRTEDTIISKGYDYVGTPMVAVEHDGPVDIRINGVPMTVKPEQSNRRDDEPYVHCAWQPTGEMSRHIFFEYQSLARTFVPTELQLQEMLDANTTRNIYCVTHMIEDPATFFVTSSQTLHVNPRYYQEWNYEPGTFYTELKVELN